MADKLEAQAKLDVCEKELDELQTSLNNLRKAEDESAPSLKDVGGTDPKIKFKSRNAGITCDNKISSISWRPSDDEHIATVLQDGKIIIQSTKAIKSPMRYYISMDNAFLKTAEWSPNGERLAVAGLDNVVTIHDIPDLQNPPDGFDAAPAKMPKAQVFEKHGGYIEAVSWLNDGQLVSAAGTGNVMLWDTNSTKGIEKEPIATFYGHDKDVCGIATHKSSMDTFVTGSSDGYAKMWDIRLRSDTKNGCVATFSTIFTEEEGGSSAGINDVTYMPSGNAFVTSGANGCLRLFDLRGMRVLQTYETPSAGDGIECSANCVSQSGAFIFSGNMDGEIDVFNTITGTHMETKRYHGEGDHITSMELSTDGVCVASSTLGLAKNFMLWA